MSYTRSILISAAVISAIFTFLFWESFYFSLSPGINAPLFFIPFVSMLAALTIRNRLPDRRFALWFLGAAGALSIFIAVRDSLFLKALNFSVIFFLLCAASLSSQGLKALSGGIVDYIMTIACAIESVTVKSCQFFLDKLPGESLFDDNTIKILAGVGKGLVLATPILAIFLALFMSADAAFNNLIKQSIHIDLNSIISQITVGISALWIIAGFMHAMFSGAYERESENPAPCKYALGLTEVSTVLGLLNLLFFSFMLVQFQYFFGGETTITLEKSMTYAEYARRGFFELVTVAALTLPTLLYFDWSLKKTSRLRVIVLRTLSITNIAMLFVIMTSAFKKMQLYQAEYGQTELRFYVTAFMIWLAVVFIIFALTVLRGHRSIFATALVGSGFLAVISLNLVNPDATIARTNLGRLKQEGSIDLGYATTLSADAVPAILSHIKHLKKNDRVRIINLLSKLHLSSDKSSDWKYWSLARMQAKKQIKQILTCKEPRMPLARCQILKQSLYNGKPDNSN